jgi:chromosome partitioning protein
MSKVVSFINYKGGVGKTTLAVEISAALAYQYSKKVLLVDVDPQTNATLYLITEKEWEDWQKSRGTMKDIFEAFMDNRNLDVRNLIITDMQLSRATGRENLHLLPSHLELYHIDLELASKFGSQGNRARSILRKALDGVKDHYDYVIIDCPPNLNLVTQNGIVASDSIIIILKPEFLSTIGIALIVRVITKIIREINEELGLFNSSASFKGPEIKGIIFNFVKYITGATKYQEEVIERIKKEYPSLVFENYLSESVKIAQRGEEKIPIAVSGHSADKNYESQILKIADEFLKRV